VEYWGLSRKTIGHGTLQCIEDEYNGRNGDHGTEVIHAHRGVMTASLMDVFDLDEQQYHDDRSKDWNG
jgi:hypothetical protein